MPCAHNSEFIYIPTQLPSDVAPVTPFIDDMGKATIVHWKTCCFKEGIDVRLVVNVAGVAEAPVPVATPN